MKIAFPTSSRRSNIVVLVALTALVLFSARCVEGVRGETAALPLAAIAVDDLPQPDFLTQVARASKSWSDASFDLALAGFEWASDPDRPASEFRPIFLAGVGRLRALTLRLVELLSDDEVLIRLDPQTAVSLARIGQAARVIEPLLELEFYNLRNPAMPLSLRRPFSIQTELALDELWAPIVRALSLGPLHGLVDPDARIP